MHGNFEFAYLYSMQTFELSEDYIQLNNLLKIEGIALTGGEAKLMIQDGLVRVNGEVASEIRKKLRKGDVVEFENERIEITSS